MKILTIIGARPQFVKAATVSRIIREESGLREVCVHTGQHYDGNMSAIFFEELEMREPEYNLGICRGNHGEQTGKMLIGIEAILLREDPDLVLVYGDTNSTLAGALAAVKLHFPLAHIEAGLRSFNRKMPEEINRILTDHASDFLFTPTVTASENLRREGIDAGKILEVGDVMLDCTNYFGAKAERQSSVLDDLKLRAGEYSLVTIHRAENTDHESRLRNILDGLEKIAEGHRLVMPVHPRTRKAMQNGGILANGSGIQVIEPVGYLDMMLLERNSKTIITDSGGVQKEAYFHGVPCITVRDETEWTELVDHGWNVLTKAENLVEVFDKARNIKVSNKINLYGNGDAAKKIVRRLRQL